MGCLKSGGEASSIIIEPQLKKKLDNINNPEININAGITYLLNRLSRSEIKSLRSDTDKNQYVYVVVSGDNLSKIANKVNTTVDELNSSNVGKTVIIRPGDKLKYYKASMERVITGWRVINSVNIAERYNGYDEFYKSKLDFIVNDLFPQKGL